MSMVALARFNIVILSLVLSFTSLTVNAAEPDWSAYNALLLDYVKPGKKNGVDLNIVNYADLAEDPRLGLVAGMVSGYSTAQLKSRQEQLAFYINAYNIWVLHLVAKHWPIESIEDIGSWLRPVWKLEIAKVDNQNISLDQIEHRILKMMREPRVHFALNCASVSCPDLRAEAYTAAELNKQLDEQATNFLANNTKGIKLDQGRLIGSMLFKWYKEDFSLQEGGVDFIVNYRPDAKVATEVVDYFKYDWSVNGH